MTVIFLGEWSELLSFALWVQVYAFLLSREQQNWEYWEEREVSSDKDFDY